MILIHVEQMNDLFSFELIQSRHRMFFFLFSLVFSLKNVKDNKPKVMELNYRAFRKNVLNRTEDQTWVVLFFDDSNQKQRDVRNDFVKTASLSLDILNFATVDAKKNVQLAEDCDVFERNLPQILIYSFKGKTEYVGNKRPDKMSMSLLKFLPKVTKIADYTWKEEIEQKNTQIKSAILFANRETVPDFWNAIAGYFAKDNIKIGYSNNKTLFDIFNVYDVPAVLFLNKSGQFSYHGKTSFKALKTAIQSFISSKFQPQESNRQSEKEPFFFSDEFEKECFSHRSFCVVYASDMLDQEFERIHDESNGKPFKWFYSSDGWPSKYPFIKEKSTWIFDPRKEKVMKIENLKHLETVINNIEGEHQWFSLSEVTQDL